MNDDFAEVLAGRRAWAVAEGDSLDVLATMPEGCVDAVVTDPPYGLGESDFSWEEKGYHRVSEGWDSCVPVTWLADAFRVLKPGGSVLCFAAWKTVEEVLLATDRAGFVRRDILVWDKMNTMPNVTARGYQFTHEFIVWATKGPRYHWQANRQVRGILRYTWSQGDRIHPTQKTVPLMADLVARHCHEDGVVLDPFCGSGTTGVACRLTGRRFLGVELNHEYAAISRRRIAEACPLFDAAAATGEVSPLDFGRDPKPDPKPPEPSLFD